MFGIYKNHSYIYPVIINNNTKNKNDMIKKGQSFQEFKAELLIAIEGYVADEMFEQELYDEIAEQDDFYEIARIMYNDQGIWEMEDVIDFANDLESLS